MNTFLKYFLGSMKRKVKCFWGNRECLGFTNKPELKNYFEGPTKKSSFCVPSVLRGYPITNSTTNQTRNFWYSNNNNKIFIDLQCTYYRRMAAHSKYSYD